MPAACADARTWCPVPGGGADALLFASLAVFICCALYSRLSAVWVLLAGASSCWESSSSSSRGGSGFQ